MKKKTLQVLVPFGIRRRGHFQFLDQTVRAHKRQQGHVCRPQKWIQY